MVKKKDSMFTHFAVTTSVTHSINSFEILPKYSKTFIKSCIEILVFSLTFIIIKELLQKL